MSWNEAVEAAARAEYERVAGQPWGDGPTEFGKRLYREDGRTVLRAALPHLLADLRALHRPVTFAGSTFCAQCDSATWPCQTVEALDRLTEAAGR